VTQTVVPAAGAVRTLSHTLYGVLCVSSGYYSCICMYGAVTGWKSGGLEGQTFPTYVLSGTPLLSVIYGVAVQSPVVLVSRGDTECGRQTRSNEETKKT